MASPRRNARAMAARRGPVSTTRFPDRGWFTVKRQAMTVDDGDPVGVYFGTTSGEVWGSADEGDSWQSIAQHLPEIYSVEVGSIGG